MHPGDSIDAAFADTGLERRRRAARRFGFVLAAGVLALYVAGFWLQR